MRCLLILALVLQSSMSSTASAEKIFGRVKRVLAEAGLGAPRGILLDLGASSLQIDDPERGFTFREAATGDMRFDRTAGGPTALDLVNTLPERELERVLREHGEEPRARAVARALARGRPFGTGADVADVVRRVDRNRPEDAEAGCGGAGCPVMPTGLAELGDEGIVVARKVSGVGRGKFSELVADAADHVPGQRWTGPHVGVLLMMPMLIALV